MKHFNGNFPVVIDIETTGLNPQTADIIELCMYPLDPQTLKMHSRVPIFHAEILPARPENIDLDAIRVQKKRYDEYASDVCSDPDKISHASLHGIKPEFCANLLTEWFENLRLAPFKRILPIAHNWVFDRSFLIEWLGWNLFDYMISPLFRDTMMMSLYDNDAAGWHGEEYPFQVNTLARLCNVLGVVNTAPHTAIGDCAATADVYRLLISKRIYV